MDADPEERIISTLLGSAPARLQGAKVEPGDDAAVLPDGTAISTDTLVEGVHFDDRLTPADVAYKAVAVSISDMAAMGALPVWMTLSLSLPRPVDDRWLEGFAKGLGEAAAKWKVALIGGDTTGSPGPVVVSVTMGGHCVDKPLRRDSGRPGDHVWLTGFPGLAAAGYAEAEPSSAALSALRWPDPPLYFALDLARLRLASAAMDLSDGLAADLRRLCKASNTGALIDASAIQLHPALAPLEDGYRYALAGGDDYELLFTAPPEYEESLRDLAAERDQHLQLVGVLTADPLVQLRGMPWPQAPFSHFQDGP